MSAVDAVANSSSCFLKRVLDLQSTVITAALNIDRIGVAGKELSMVFWRVAPQFSCSCVCSHSGSLMALSDQIIGVIDCTCAGLLLTGSVMSSG